MIKNYTLAAVVVLVSFAGACTPKIIVMDEQTILEKEAAGEWPQLENLLLENATVQGPTPISRTAVTAKKARLYTVLNGGMEKQ